MILTKVFGILCVAFIIVQAKKIGPEEREMFMMFTEECRKTHKASDDDMNAIMDVKIPETKEAKCTMTCAMKQFKMKLCKNHNRSTDQSSNESDEIRSS